MRTTILLTSAFALAASAATIVERQRDCQADYTKCQAAGRSLVACQCDLATCSGEDNARTREYCASATASLSTASSTTTGGTTGPSSAPNVVINAAPGSLKLGAQCSDTTQCAGGAECWASNAMLQKACGNFNANCKTDSQCAYNSCNNGLCNGFLASTSASSTSTAAPGPSAAPNVVINAAPGSLKLGQQCSETSQCSGGAQCWASNAMLQKACGNFNAACTSNGQCAYNTCNNGLCNGILPSASYPANTATATGKTNGTVATGTTKAPSATSTGVVKFTGAASKEQVGAGVAIVAALFAAVL